MDDKKCVGAKCFRIKESTHYTAEIDNEVYEVTKVIDYKTAKDHCNHLILKNSRGEEFEVKDYYAVVCPDESLPADEMIQRYLSDNGVYAEVYIDRNKFINVLISWGDWKHEHMWATTLMHFLGYKQHKEIVIEEDGSDCYSARHTYFKVLD